MVLQACQYAVKDDSRKLINEYKLIMPLTATLIVYTFSSGVYLRAGQGRPTDLGMGCWN